MNALAATKLGVVFVYDVGSDTIRKFIISFDNTCSATQPVTSGVPSASEMDGGASLPASAPQETDASSQAAPAACGSTKVATEYPVDSSVQTVFNGLHTIYTMNSALVMSSVTKAPDPIDPVTGKPFDLRNVAWELPNGTFQRFISFLQQSFDNQQDADNFSPGLGSYLWAFQIDSKTVSVAYTGSPNGGGLTISGSLTWQMNNQTQLHVCDNDNNCANFTLTVVNHVLNMTYNTVTDSQMNIYPSPSQKTPNPSWTWHGHFAGGGSFAFGTYLQSKGISIGGSGFQDNCGGDYLLECTWKTDGTTGKTSLVGCSIECW